MIGSSSTGPEPGDGLADPAGADRADTPRFERRVPLPPVRRFNRRTLALFAALIVAAVAAAFGTALSRRPPLGPPAEAAAQRAPAGPALSDAVAALPRDYAQWHDRLGARSRSGTVDRAEGAPPSSAVQPAESRAAAPGPGPAAGYAVPVQAAAPADPLAGALAQALIDAARRQVHARESGFSFAAAGPTASAVAPAAGAPSGLSGAPLAAALEGLRGVAHAGTPVPAAASGSARDEANRQDDKAAFLERGRGTRPALQGVRSPGAVAHTLFAGTVIPGVLVTGIDSDLPGQIAGRVSGNVYDTVSGNELLIPQGSTLLGSYDSRITYGAQRVLIVWTRLIRPDGSSLDLETMPGVDLSGYAGLTGDVDRHVLHLLGAVVMGSLVQAGAQAGTTLSSLGAESFEDRSRQGFGAGVNSATQQIVRRDLGVQPTLRVAPGERFNVFTTRDIVITPYPMEESR